MIELVMGGIGGIISTSIIYFIKSKLDKRKEITIEDYRNELVKDLEEHKNIINRKQFYLDNFYQDYRLIFNKMYDIESTLETFMNAELLFHITNDNAERYVTLNEKQIKDYHYGEKIDLVKRVNYFMFLQILSDDIIEMRDKFKSSSLLFDDEENMLLNEFADLANKSMHYLRDYTSENMNALSNNDTAMNNEVIEKNLERLKSYTLDIRRKFRHRFVFDEDTN